MTLSQREAVIAEARSWLRTPYHSHAQVKGAGADCAMMPLAVYRSVLDLPDVPLPKWVQQFNLHRSEESYLNYVRALGARETGDPEPGDFLLVRIGRCFSHGAIITGWPKVIHAVNPRGVVLANGIETIGRRPHLFFTF